MTAERIAAQGAAAAPFDASGHLLQIHDSEPARQAGLAAWVAQGLERGEKVVLARSSVLSPHESVLRMLDRHDIPVGDAVGSGRLEVAAPSRLFDHDTLDRLVPDAVAQGRRGVRICAEVETGLSVLTPAGYEEFERAVDRLCRGRGVSALCQYSAARTVGGVLEGAARVHRSGLRAPALSTSSADPGELYLAGEVDLSNDAALAVALRSAAGRAGRVLHVDLSRLEFVAVAGVRALLAGSRAHREAGGRLVLWGVRPGVAAVLRTCAVDRVPGVQLLGDASGPVLEEAR